MSTMLVARVDIDMATSFTTVSMVFILLVVPSPSGAAPNSLRTIQVHHFISRVDVHFHFQIFYQEDETDELPTFDMTFEGDIVRRSSNASDPLLANAHLANPKMLWPGGVIEYKFYWTFPRCLITSVLQTVGYMSRAYYNFLRSQ